MHYVGESGPEPIRVPRGHTVRTLADALSRAGWVVTVTAPPRTWRERLGRLVCLIRGHYEAYPASHPYWRQARGTPEPNWCRRCRRQCREH